MSDSLSSVSPMRLAINTSSFRIGAGASRGRQSGGEIVIDRAQIRVGAPKAFRFLASLVLAAMGLSCGTSSPAVRSCSAAVLTAADAWASCADDTDGRVHLAAISAAFDQELHRMKPRPADSGNAVFYLLGGGIGETCVASSSSDRVREDLEALLERVKMSTRSELAECTNGTRVEFGIGGALPLAPVGCRNAAGKPQAIVRIPPRYPDEAAKNRVEGWVELAGEIGLDGTLKNARVLSSEPPGIFEDAALAAFTRWRYCPVALPDSPTETVRLRQRFQIN